MVSSSAHSSDAAIYTTEQTCFGRFLELGYDDLGSLLLSQACTLNTNWKLSDGDVISCSRRLLAAEIDKSPFLINEKTRIICEWYAVDSKLVLNTNRNHGHCIKW
jgi:hypothetical protein